MSLARALVAASFMVAASWLWGGRLRLRIRPTRQCGGRSDLLGGPPAVGPASAEATSRAAVSRGRTMSALAAGCHHRTGVGPALRRAARPDRLSNRGNCLRVGADAEALAVVAREWNLSVLTGLAAVWTVSRGSGAGLARAAEQLGRSALDSEQIRREMSAEFVGSRIWGCAGDAAGSRPAVGQ
jgi:hypothetical protein